MSTGDTRRLIEDPVNLLLSLHKANNHSVSFSNHDKTTSPSTPTESKHRKRQVQPVEPVNPEVRPPFFRIRNFFRFIRRVISLVTVPVIRFAQRLVMPWRRKFVPARPTSPRTLSSSTTEIITNFRSVIENSTMKTESLKGKNETKSYEADLDELEESIVIYESDAESTEPRLLRNTQNTTFSPSPTVDSLEIFIQQAESSDMQSMYELDKCATMEKNFAKLNVSQIANFVTTSTESPPDAITHLGTHLQFMQILYNCCNARRAEILISWMDTRVLVNNVVVENTAGCGNF